MSAGVAELRGASAAEWDAAWRACPGATFFQSRAWAEAFAALPGGTRPDPRMVVFDDGLRVLLPVSVRDGAALSSPAGCYGGWLADDALGPRHAEALVRTLQGLHRGLVWRVSPFDPLQAAHAPVGARPDTTLAVRLDDDFDGLLRRWRKGHRAAARQARRGGVEVRRAKTEDDWRAYFAVYEDTLRRWGERATSRYPWALFRALAGLEDVHLWLAEREGRVLAGALCLASTSHVAYWHGAAREDALPLRPVHLLVRTAVREAVRGGHAWFDLNPSGGHAGVAAFKRGFGAEALTCPVVERRPRRGLLRRALGRLR